MSQALYRKWRPRRWEEIIGQEHVIQTLRNAVAGERVVHAYLFSGPRGTGKTTTARILAKAVNCLDPNCASRPCDHCEYCKAINEGRFLDLIEIDAASNTSVEDVRNLREKINFSPNQGRFKVYVVDEVHMLSTAAFNALLKTLEEPPSHAIFILATTEVHKIPATVLSRCQRHEFRRIPVNEIVTQLNKLAEEENLQCDPEALVLIARQATGSMRDAISLLDQLASSGQTITLDFAQSVLGTATSQVVIDLVSALIKHDATQGLNTIHAALDSGSDPRQVSRQIIEYLRTLLLIQMNNYNQVEISDEVLATMRTHAQTIPTSLLLQFIRLFNQTANDVRAAWQPALPLEIALIDAVQISESPQSSSEQPGSTPTKTALSRPHPEKRVTPEAKDSALPRSPKQVSTEATTESGEASQILNKHWGEVLSLARRKNASTYGLLNSCKSRHVDGNVLVLGFASDVLKNQMAKKENIAVAQEVVSQILGREVNVRCVINTAARTTIPAEVDNDGLVAAALRDLGGEIIDIQDD
jgi:DNA polymerase III subunit gamma/tau